VLVSNVTVENCLEKGHPLHCRCGQSPGSEPAALRGWTQRIVGKLVRGSGCWAEFRGSTWSPQSSPRFLCGAEGVPEPTAKQNSWCLKPFLSAETQEWGLAPRVAALVNPQRIVSARRYTSVHVPFVFSFYFH